MSIDGRSVAMAPERTFLRLGGTGRQALAGCREGDRVI
jgi:hypothetical protein